MGWTSSCPEIMETLSVHSVVDFSILINCQFLVLGVSGKFPDLVVVW